MDARRAGSTGFTLVEVLVALMIMAVMAVMAWQGVDGIVRARDSNRERLERSLRLNTVLAQWEQDLAALQETSVLPSALAFDGARLRLTRRSGNGVQLVVWTLHPEGASQTWLRWAGPAVTTTGALQDYWLRSQQFQGTEAGQLRVLSGLSQWQVYFYSGNAWGNAQSSLGAATPAAGASAPAGSTAAIAGVRLVLGFAPDSGYGGELVRDTLMSP